MPSSGGSEDDPRKQQRAVREATRRPTGSVPADTLEDTDAPGSERVADSPGGNPGDWRGKCGLPRTIRGRSLYCGCGRYILTFNDPTNPNLQLR